MSAGPIKAARDAWAPHQVSTPDAHRVCAKSGDRAYCGRARKVTLAQSWDKVTCTDCRAAYRADGGRIELFPGVNA